MDLLAEEEGKKYAVDPPEAEAEDAVLLQLHCSSLAVVPVAGVAIDILNVEEAATGLRSAMTALEVHKGSVAAVAGKRAEVESEEVEHCFARKVEFESEGVEHCLARMVEVDSVEVEHCPARKVEVESEEVEHCSARTAVMLRYFPVEAGIEAGQCRRKNWVVR
jgi:hypothetical protein